MTKTLRLISMILAVASCLTVSASMQFQDLRLNTRLSSNMINTIFQDSRGFLYFGTATGMNRYDGYLIEVFRQAGDDGPTDNYILNIQEAPDGNLWVLTSDKYVAFDPIGKEYLPLEPTFQQMGVGDMPALVRIEDKKIWMRTYDGNLFRYEDDELTKVKDPLGYLSQADITSMRQIAPSRLLAATANGKLLVIDADAMEVHEALTIPGAGEGAFIHNIFIDRDKNIWLYGVDGLWILEYSTGKWLDNYHGFSLQVPIIKDIAQDAEGNIWIAFEHDGLTRIKPDGSVETSKDTPANNRRLSNNSLTSLLCDRTGTLWIGSRKSGISSYHPKALQFGYYPLPDINCELPAGNGDVWLGTDTDGLLLWNPAQGIKQAYKEPFVRGNDVNAIVCMCHNDKGLWIGTYNGGLWNLRDGHWRSFTTRDGLVSDNIWSLLPLDNDDLLIGTLGGGLQRFSPTNGSVKTWTTANCSIGSNYIGSISAMGGGKYALGTSYGLSILDIYTGEITNFLGGSKGTHKFSHPNINQAFVDSRGLIWLATCSGINIYDPKHDQAYHLRDYKEVPEFILGLQEDQQGNIWATIGSNLECIQISGQPGDYAFDIKRYDEYDGLQRGDFNQRSLCLDTNGQLLVGGLKGLNAFIPAELSQKTAIPSVYFTHIPNVKDGSVFAEFASDDYLNPEKNVFTYILEGSDKEWTTLPAGVRSVNFANLAPGNYTLRVKAINDAGMQSEPLSAKIKVPAPWYFQWWALLIFGFIIASLFYLSYLLIKRRERLIYIRRQQEELASKQEELNQLKFKFFTNISHELRTPLTLITAPLDSIMKREHDATTQRQLGIIQSNANRLLMLVNQLLDFRKAEMSGLTLHASSGDIVEFTHNICDSFLMFSEKKNVPLSFHSAIDHLYMDFDEDKIGKVVMNLLSNAMKFTPEGGKVDVTLEREADNLVLKVADTGCGISDADKQKVFERFYQAAESLNSHISGSGIGLSLVAEYVRLHDGKVEIKDNEPKGAIFEVTIPIRQTVAPAPEIAPDAPTEESAPSDHMTAHPSDSILVVDDNNDLLDFISSELSGEYHIITAHNGKEALEKIRASKPEMIISDIMMPEMDGIELCRQLKADKATASLPLLLLTAKHDVAAKIEGLTLGADDYMTKPFNMDVLRLRIRALLGLRKQGLRRPLIDPEPEPIEITSLDEQLIEKCVKYVQDRMDDPELSVESLSDRIGMSRVHLYKKLKQITGKTPIEFIRILRLKRAAQLLHESQLTVAEIAYKCGFNNPKYFSKYFRDEFGMIPSQYQATVGK